MGFACTLVIALAAGASASASPPEVDPTTAEARDPVKASKPPVEAFGNLPDVTDIQISPDGGPCGGRLA
jgi:hypothetical protein